MRPFVTQPGPPAAERISLLPSAGEEVAVTLRPGLPLEDAVAEAMAGYAGGWLVLEDAAVEELSYVIPAHATDATHVAWYSETFGFRAGRIDRLGMIVGRHAGASFLHGHGLWQPEGGGQVMGHILAPLTRLARPVVARGIGLATAGFDRRPDAETHFDLFHVAGEAGIGPFAALRLAPNCDITASLAEACARLGWPAARAHGVGSLIGTRFADGTRLDSRPTEFLIRDAPVGPGAPPLEVEIVGIDGADIRRGALAPGANAVLITAELVLARRETAR